MSVLPGRLVFPGSQVAMWNGWVVEVVDTVKSAFYGRPWVTCRHVDTSACVDYPYDEIMPVGAVARALLRVHIDRG